MIFTLVKVQHAAREYMSEGGYSQYNKNHLVLRVRGSDVYEHVTED